MSGIAAAGNRRLIATVVLTLGLAAWLLLAPDSGVGQQQAEIVEFPGQGETAEDVWIHGADSAQEALVQLEAYVDRTLDRVAATDQDTAAGRSQARMLSNFASNVQSYIDRICSQLARDGVSAIGC